MGEETTEEENIKEQQSLVGRFCMERNISRDMIQSTMEKIWRLHKAATFKEAEKNLFTITFSTEAEKQRVLAGRL